MSRRRGRATIVRLLGSMSGLTEQRTIELRGPVPIFPLPNCVLLPRAILPLHIFEPRYREMLADCLNSSPLIAMAVLSPGYEEKYYTHVAAIRPVVCVGEIMRHEKLEDGRYNILLQGLTRATVVSEDREKSYRRGVLKPVACLGLTKECEASLLRKRVLAALSEPRIRGHAAQCGWSRVAEAADIPLSDVVDYLASGVSGDADRAVKFLEEPDLSRRIEMLIEEMRRFAERHGPAETCAARPWPRRPECN